MQNTTETPIKGSSNFAHRFVNSDKTSALLLHTPSPNTQQKHEKACENNIESYTPVGKNGTPDQFSRAPLSIISRNTETKLHKVSEYGSTAVYSSNVTRTKELSGDQLKQFLEFLFESVEEVKGLAACEPYSTKIQEETFTAKTRENARKRIQKEGKRHPSQQEAMADKKETSKFSATQIVNEFFTEEKIQSALEKMKLTEDEISALKEQFLNIVAEWLHMLDYANVGNKGQRSDNLIFGTTQANAHMMVIEELEKHFIEKGKKLNVKVEAKVVKFHIAYEIKLTLSHDKEKESFTFNPFTRVRPIKETRAYIEAAEKALRHKKRFDLSTPDIQGLFLWTNPTSESTTVSTPVEAATSSLADLKL